MLIARRSLPRLRALAPRWQFQRYSSTNASSPPDAISPAFLERARSIAAEHAELSEELSGTYDVKTARKVGELGVTTTALRDWEQAHASVTELQQLLNDATTDDELRSIAAEEIESSSQTLQTVSLHLKRSLVPAHPFAHLPCLLELRPGAGGSEAGLFAGDLLRMYQAYCKRHGLRASIMKIDESEGMGNDKEIQEAVVEIEGEGAYGLLRCEAGVHRVQRVPATEKQGRTHTSAVSVLVLPSFPANPGDDLGANSFDDPSSDYYINVADVRTDVMRARGAGGQHVNTTDSAVRLTHMPTNTVVACQEGRSQHKNREKAWQILRSRIAQARREAREEELAKLRVGIIGIAKMGRGDKIRTYNWGQQRCTDHRSGVTVHNLNEVLEGGHSLDEVMNSVRTWLAERDLEALAADEEAANANVT